MAPLSIMFESLHSATAGLGCRLTHLCLSSSTCYCATLKKNLKLSQKFIF